MNGTQSAPLPHLVLQQLQNGLLQDQPGALLAYLNMATGRTRWTVDVR